MPEMVVREELRQGRWRPAHVEGISFRRPISLCSGRGQSSSPFGKVLEMVEEEKPDGSC
ncbi:hypothetical protein HMPREF9374_3194 [Desmospora sp. 8437]|nr:hypothetical protein HMPREF9374_3194 [Desmospora sp. 8437]